MKKMETLREAMKDSISEILETMFFMPIEFPEADELTQIKGPAQAPFLSAKLAYQGPLSGTFFVLAPKPLVEELAANLLGLEKEEVGSEDVEATLKELLNMVAGKTFGLYDSQLVFHLGVPELIEPEPMMRWIGENMNEALTINARTVNNTLYFRITVV